MYKKLRLLTTMLLLAVCCGVWAQTTYKLTQVTSVEASGLYVFEQDGYVMNNTVSSNALQTTNIYKTTGLTGTETYVWILKTATDGFYMKNNSLTESNGYLNNTAGKTNLSFGTSSATTIWSFSFQQDATVIIKNIKNSNRFLGYTDANSHAYRAYAASNLDDYSHAIKVYKLEEETGGETPSLQTNDLALTGAPITLSLDLYPNAAPQTINYTTSSTGAVTVSESDYATFEVDQENKTITVTPAAVTPIVQTITVSQAADDTYAAGSVTFTVSITDSTPFTGGDVTFDATVDTGTSPLTKNEVNFACTNGVLDNGTEYRLYANSTTTFSLSENVINKGYKITSIVFTDKSGYSVSNFATPTITPTAANGGVSNWNKDEKTWTGEVTSISFKAGSQVRCTQIVVTVEKPKTLSSIAITTPPTNVTYTEGETFDPAGMVVTATYTDDSTAPVEGYTFTPDGALTMDDTNITISYTENGIIKTASQNITVTEAPSHTATFSVNGEVVSTANVKEGFAIEFPSNAEAPEGYSIFGWLAEEMSAPQDEAPANIIPSAVMGNADVTYYAVLAICTTSGSQDTYALVSNIDDLNDGDKFILVSTGSYTSSGVSYDFTVANGEINENNLMDPVDVTISENKVTSTSVAPITLVAVEGGWKLQMGTQYLNIVSGKNIIALDDEGAINTITFNNGVAIIGGIADGSDTRNIYYNPNNGDGRFAYYRSSQKNVAIYKQDISTTYSNYCTTTPVPVSISAAGMATLSSNKALDFTNVETIEAYYATLDNSGNVAYHRIHKVPAETGLLIRNAAGEAQGAVSDNVPTLTGTAESVEGNILVAALEAITGLQNQSDGYKNYILNNHSQYGLGFYLANGKNLAANRAYMRIPVQTAREFIGINFDGDATGIESIRLNGTDNAIYDLQGRKVMNPAKGLYIVNGKKVVVK